MFCPLNYGDRWIDGQMDQSIIQFLFSRKLWMLILGNMKGNEELLQTRRKIYIYLINNFFCPHILFEASNEYGSGLSNEKNFIGFHKC